LIHENLTSGAEVAKKSDHGKKTVMSGDKNIISLSAAKIAAFLFYGIKFLSKPNDKNFISFPTVSREEYFPTD
jgi:hypothetical protein